MRKLRLAILENEDGDAHLLWIKACESMKQSVEWAVVNITKSSWLRDILCGSFDGLLAVPSGNSISFKILYDERVRILNTICGIPVFPSLEEIMIYENKKYLSYWLEANNIPHPKTWIFYYEKEALNFIQNAGLPMVAKTNIGASGSGVSILYSFEEAEQYIRKIFSGAGIKRKVGPKWRRRGFAKRVIEKLMNPKELRLKLLSYRNARSEVQRDFVLLQEYIPHTFEWRCVRIGDSFFAHKKLVRHEKASGSLLKSYDRPSDDLLNFVKQITDLKNFQSQAVDIFVAQNGAYLVNEMQCIFGQSDPYQMLINGQPGRYIFDNGGWVFEAGDFNKYESFLLRLETFTTILAGNKAN
jgi:hypothetical protein